MYVCINEFCYYTVILLYSLLTALSADSIVRSISATAHCAALPQGQRAYLSVIPVGGGAAHIHTHTRVYTCIQIHTHTHAPTHIYTHTPLTLIHTHLTH